MNPSDIPPLHVVVVENHEDSRTLLCMLLEAQGHTVHAADSVAATLTLLPRVRCDVLISDIGLPDGDGWQLLGALPQPLPYAIAMSGYGTQGDRDRSLAAGFRHHLVKPSDPPVLERLLREAAEELDGERVAPPVSEARQPTPA